MKVANRLVGSLRVGLLGLALLAVAVEARTNFDEAGGISLGVRGGAMLPSSDLDGVMAAHGAALLRYGLRERLQAEVGVGYGRYTTEDNAWGINTLGRLVRMPGTTEEYYTHLSFAQLRLLWAPVTYRTWAPYIFGGAGYTYYNVEDLTPRRGSFDGIGSTLGIPLGVGARYELSPKVGLEGSLGYTLTMSDEIDESDDGGGNDNYFELMLGLTYDLTLGRYAEPVMPVAPVVRPEAPVDQDGDGLTDVEERTQYYTNPLMADSDGDGLNDGSEVKVYRTNPNKADSDGGGVDDGTEVDRGTDPLDAADDIVRVEAPAMPPVDYEFPVVYFPLGGAELTAEARRDLEAAAQVLMEYRGVLLQVRGFTDNTGYTADNMRLSWRRAYAVKDYLAKIGVAPWRLTVRAYGEVQPIASNDTAEGRQRNRRVELILVQ